MIEIWKKIPDYDGYLVSDQGQFWSCRRNRFLKPHRQKNGYEYVHLNRKSGMSFDNIRAHILILKTFVGNCKKGQEARHLNGIKHDNRLNNLCWGTKSENFADKKRHGISLGGFHQKFGTLHPYSRFTEDDIKTIRMRIKRGDSQYNIARDYNISQSQISRIKTGVTYHKANERVQARP